MSVRDAKTTRAGDQRVFRLLALGGAGLVVGAFLGVVYGIVDVIADPTVLEVVVVATLLGATLAGRYLPIRTALGVAAALLVGGLGWYLAGLSGVPLSPWPHVRYVLALLAGNSVLGIVNLESWVLAVIPAPVFLTWYLAVRRRHVASATVGGATTLFFVLTGDAGTGLTLLGVVGVLTLVAAGELEGMDASVGELDVVVTALAIVIVASATVTIVPAGGAFSVSPDGGVSGVPGAGAGSGGGTLERSLLSAPEELSVKGSLTLSSDLRFAVESDEEQYWRVAGYDLYTGEGWVRRTASGATTYRLRSPPGQSRTVTQRYRAITGIDTMPAVWRPTNVSGSAAGNVRVMRLGGLEPTDPLAANDTYRVRSAVPNATAAQLRNASEDYPDWITDQFLQLPDSTPERVAERTREVTADADTPYDTARAIEEWLESNREYSLNVSRPSDSIADSFLFEMERGYCTYYATTMATMLRTQDIPARFVVGYTSGQRVAEDEWVVRGHNSHAWVEAYFPEIGWVRFDPTPAGPRVATAQADLESAREANASNVDTNRTDDGEWTPTPTEPATPDSNTTDTNISQGNPSIPGEFGPGGGPDVPESPADENTTATVDPVTTVESTTDTQGGDGEFSPPGIEQLALGALALVGIAGVARRSGVVSRAYRAVWLRWQPRGDPERDVGRAVERLEYLLQRRHRPRRPGETVSDYLEAIDADGRAQRVATIYERARYAGEIDRTAADEAIDIVDDLVAGR